VSRENKRLQKACERLREEKEAVEERVREGTIERASGLDEELEGVREEAERERGRAEAEIVKLRQTNKLL
jgi:hypothetical protein